MDWTVVATTAMGVAGACAGSLVTLKGTRETVRNARADAREAREDARQAWVEARADARQRDQDDDKRTRRNWTYERLWRAIDLAKTNRPIDLLFSHTILRTLVDSDVLQPEDMAMVDQIVDHVEAMTVAMDTLVNQDIEDIFIDDEMEEEA